MSKLTASKTWANQFCMNIATVTDEATARAQQQHTTHYIRVSVF